MTPTSARLRERFDADPSDRAAFAALEEEYFVAAQSAELIALYEAHLAACESTRTPPDRARLHFRLGQALEENGELDRAGEAFRAALALDPSFTAAQQRLRAFATEQGNFDEALAATLEDGAPPAQSVRALVEIGERALEAAQPAAALRSFEEALAREAANARALVGAARALEASQRPQDAAAAWERALRSLTGDVRADAIEALTMLQAKTLADPDAALLLLAHAAESEPNPWRWLDRRFTLLIEIGRHADAAALGATRFERCSDPDQRAEIALELGRLHLDVLNAPAEARSWLERAAEGRNDGAAHLALAEAAGRTGDAAGRVLHLERAMELGAEIPAWSALGLDDAADADRRLEALRTAAADHPDDPDALEALAAALATHGEDAERVAVLARRARLPGCEADEAAELWFEIGEIRLDSLADAAGAADAFTQGLHADPVRALGIDALEAVLRQLGRLADLGEILAPVIEAAPTARRAALQCRLANAALERGDAAAALASFRAALEAEPGNARAEQGLVRAAESGGDEVALFEAWSREAAHCAPDRLDALGRSALERALASDEPERGLPLLQLWAERSGSRSALESLTNLLGELGRSDALGPVLDRLDAHLDATERAAHRRRLGYQHAAEGRADAALAAWREALRHDPGDVASHEALVSALAESGADADLVSLCDASRLASPLSDARYGQALERMGRIEDAARVLRAVAASGAADATSVAAFVRVARATGDPAALAEALALDPGSDAAERDQRAFERAELLDQVLDRPSEAHAAYLAIENEAADPALRARAAESLDALLERSGAIGSLCHRLAARIESLDPPAALATHRRLMDLAEHRLGDLERARLHLESALALDRSSASLWQRAASLAPSAAAKMHAFEGELTTSPERDRALALHLGIGRLAEEIRDDRRAVEAYRAALAIAPGDPEAARYVEALLEREGRHAERADLLQTRLAACGDAEPAATEIRLSLATLLSEQLGRHEEAAALLEDAVRSAGPIARLVEPLAGLLERLERHAACADLCESAAAIAGEPAAAARLFSRAAEASRLGGDVARAARAQRRALEVDPDARAHRSALIALSRELGDDAALVDLLEREIETPGADALALHCELTLRCAALHQTERACVHALAAATLAPHDATLREPAIDRCTALGRHDDVAALLALAAGDARSAEREGLWRRHAELVATRDPAAAVVSFERSLAIDAQQPAVHRARRIALERLGRSAEALVELEAEIEAAPRDERILAIAHAADLALAAHGPADALPWLGRLVAERPADADVWIGLARRYALAGQPRAQERSLREAQHRCARPADAAAIARERAALLETLDEPGLALAAWRIAQDLVPDDPSVLAALDRLYATAVRTRERLDVLERRAARARGVMRSQLLRQAAENAHSLGEVERAASLWEAAVAPELLPSAERQRLLERAVDAQRRGGRVDAFLALAESELLAPRDAEREAALRRELAQVWRRERARPDRALAHLRALADRGLANADDRSALLAALRAAGARAEVASRLEAELRANPDDAQAWQELATLREEALWDANGAAEAWRALARLAPDSATALAGLRRANERAGDARGVDAALEREIELGSVDAASSWRRLGRLRRESLRDLAGAEHAYERARALDPTHRESLAALRELAEVRNDWDRALDLGLLEIESVDASDTRTRQSLWLHRAGRAAGPASDLAGAVAAYEEADALGDLSAAALAAWAGLLRDVGPAARWREVFARACDHRDAKAEARDHLLLAQALADAGQAGAAEQRLERVFELAPDHAGAWALAARLHEGTGDAEAICQAWSRAAQASSGLDAARAWRAAAAPFETHDASRALGLLDRAAQAYPSFAPAHAARAVAAERLGRFEDAIAAAKAALDGRGIAAPLLREEHRDAARAGARAAHALSRWGDAWQLASEALALAPGDADSLLAQGIAAQQLGSAHAARRALEAWLATDPPEALRAVPLCALGQSLASLGEAEAALRCFDDALAIDPALDAAHAAACALLEAGDDRRRAAEAWARRAEASDAPERRADAFVRAAAVAGDADARAGDWLLGAIVAQSSHASAWLAWLEHLRRHGSEDQLLAAAVEGAAQVVDPHAAARLEIERARILETRGDERGARQGFVHAVELDASLDEAAWNASRLLCAAGEWSDAAACLGAAAERHPDPHVRASLHAERGRLFAGPLEDITEATAAYERARALAPDRVELREALAAVWAQQPAMRDRAVAELIAVLAIEPVRPSAWRRLARLLRSAGRTREADLGMALLRALGAAAAAEREHAPERFALAIARPKLDDDFGQTLREAFRAIAGDWAEALGDVEEPVAANLDPVLGAISRAWRAACTDDLGPALATLAPDQLAAQAEALVWTALGAASTVEASRETRAVIDRLSGRALRRLRRGIGDVDPQQLRRFDFAAWTTSLRAAALATAVDRCEGDIRAGLCCARADALRASGEALAPEADLTPFALGAGTSRALVSLAVRAWVGAI